MVYDLMLIPKEKKSPDILSPDTKYYDGKYCWFKESDLPKGIATAEVYDQFF